MNGDSDRIGVVVLHYRNWPEVAETIRSLVDQTVSVDVVVVDNASGDGSAGAIAAEFPDVRLERLRRNRGFGAGMNHGARLLPDAAMLFFASHEVVLAPTALQELAQSLKGGVAAVGPRIVHRDTGEIFSTGGAVRDDGTTLHHDKPNCAVEWLDGGALMMIRTAFESVGGFDEGYFLYYEDVEIGHSLRRLGLRLQSVSTVEVRGRPTSTLPWLLVRRNRLRFVERCLGRRRAFWVSWRSIRTGAGRLLRGDPAGALGVIAPVIVHWTRLPAWLLHRFSNGSRNMLIRRREQQARPR